MANSREEESFYGKSGWRSQPMLRSLSEVHRTLVVPHPARFYRKLLAFAGAAFALEQDGGSGGRDLADDLEHFFHRGRFADDVFGAEPGIELLAQRNVFDFEILLA